MARLKPIWLHLTALAERLERQPRVVVACDLDGTIVPLETRPDEVHVGDRVRGALRRLAELDGATVAVVSGRRLADLESRLAIENVFLAGAAGLETRDERGQRREQEVPELELPNALLADLRAWCERFPGSWMEDKRYSIALHYAAVAPALQPAYGAGVRRRVRPHGRHASIVHGKKVFEILPAARWTKATAVERWLVPRTQEATLLYLGDDSNDEPVHALVRDRHGVSIAVGRLASQAEYGLPSPREAVWFLEWLGRQWGMIAERRGVREAEPVGAGRA